MEKKIKWFNEAVVYQIYPLSFKDSNNDGIGDINGITSKLSYIKSLGVDVIWLSPVYQSPMKDNGYDISHYQKVNAIFGNLEDLKKLIHKTHEYDMKIIMDLVINHTSNQHEWFKKSQIRDLQYSDYYIWRDQPTDVTSIFGGSAWTYCEERKQYYFHLFAKEQPDLNWNHAGLRNEIYKMINKWLEMGIDGFRLDVIDLIGKDVDKKVFADGPYLETYLKELHTSCFDGKDVMTVGEMPGITIERASALTDENKPYLNMVFQFSHIGLDEIKGQGKWALKDLDLLELKQTFNHVQQTFNKKGWNALFLSNHDQPRILFRYGSIKYPQQSAKMLATMIYGMQGTPFIYQGEEIGMTGVAFKDIEQYRDIETKQIFEILSKKGYKQKDIMRSIHKKSRDNSRTPFQWDDSVYAGFSKHQPWIEVNENYKTINAKNSIDDRHSVYHYYKKLFQIRKSYKVFTYGDFKIFELENPNHFSYYRQYRDEVILIICSFSEKPQRFNLKHKNFEIMISNDDQIDFNHTNIIPPFYTGILRIGD